MKRGKHGKPYTPLGGNKPILTLACLALVLCTAVGGTLAWLITETEPIVNTFTYGDIHITLEETDTNRDDDNDPRTNTYSMIPGHTIHKDPTVTFKANSENAWLFVKLERSANFDEFMTCETADGWTALSGVNGVYYREVAKAATDVAFEVIRDNTVTVKGEVTKDMLNALDTNGTAQYPTLTVTAYAVQRDDHIATAADAWDKVSPTP